MCRTGWSALSSGTRRWPKPLPSVLGLTTGQAMNRAEMTDFQVSTSSRTPWLSSRAIIARERLLPCFDRTTPPLGIGPSRTSIVTPQHSPELGKPRKCIDCAISSWERRRPDSQVAKCPSSKNQTPKSIRHRQKTVPSDSPAEAKRIPLPLSRHCTDATGICTQGACISSDSPRL